MAGSNQRGSLVYDTCGPLVTSFIRAGTASVGQAISEYADLPCSAGEDLSLVSHNTWQF